MNKQSDDLEKIEKESIEFYKKILKEMVIDKKSILPLQTSGLDEYIAVFSLYIRSSNNAYRYNLPYLSHQNKKFGFFLESASRKCDLLKMIMQEVKKSPSILQFINQNPQNASNTTISLNDFFTSDLNGDITFHESFSISGAERNSKNDVLTIQYNSKEIKRVRTCKELVKTDGSTLNSDKIIQLVEKVIGIYRN